MESQQPFPPSKLFQFPDELLINILWFTDSVNDAVNLARTCKPLYFRLMTEIWKVAGRESDWSYMFEAIRDNNFSSFKNWLAIAPVDHRSSGVELRPLHMAVMYYRPAMVKLILNFGANPNFIESDILCGWGEVDWISPLHHAVKATLAPRVSHWGANATRNIWRHPCYFDILMKNPEFLAAAHQRVGTNLNEIDILRNLDQILDDAGESVPKRGLRKKRKQKRMPLPRRWELQSKGRQIITALRQAGANESALGAEELFPGAAETFPAKYHELCRSLIGEKEREHLDNIEVGDSCCDRHKVLEKSL
ncbi:hypothetical protein F53441_8099 [Fusarium austroafricanum]|uniref:F-box domain-containing protein n=1 Tax=Fusarium austroafricanum TaxID=2364996 RepID=A0A8H4KFU5_9HYPO|nr:hypothetical protein F53441_8099 [Fusarium austroafricanum]